MDFEFYKMHGAGNDFVIIDDRDERVPAADRDALGVLGRRRTGIGCEGFILIQPSAVADLRMRFFNPDGSEVEMCGNGARCFARLAHDLGAAPLCMRVETIAGILTAEVLEDGDVRLHMTAPTDWRLDLDLDLQVTGKRHRVHHVNSGVPHAVIVVDDVAGVPLRELGAAIRYHEAFAPAGTNVNVATVTGPHSMRLRTYERGVEDETLACGTGMVATALLAGRLGLVEPPVELTCGSGDRLEVGFCLTPDGADGVTLRGPATHVYRGIVTWPEI